MPWDPANPDIGDALMQIGDPPEELAALLENEAWAWIFGCWSADLDAHANILYHRLREGEMPTEEITQWFRDDGLRRFGAAVVDLRMRLVEIERERQESQRADLEAAQYAQWAAQHGNAETPAITFDDGTYDAITSVNRQELGRLDVGEEIEYRQVGRVVLIGEGQPWEYYAWAYDQEGYAGGTITVRSRRARRPGSGGTAQEPEKDAGETAYIDVTGCAATDRQAFLDEMRRLDRLDRLGELTEETISFR